MFDSLISFDLLFFKFDSLFIFFFILFFILFFLFHFVFLHNHIDDVLIYSGCATIYLSLSFSVCLCMCMYTYFNYDDNNNYNSHFSLLDDVIVPCRSIHHICRIDNPSILLQGQRLFVFLQFGGCATATADPLRSGAHPRKVPRRARVNRYICKSHPSVQAIN